MTTPSRIQNHHLTRHNLSDLILAALYGAPRTQLEIATRTQLRLKTRSNCKPKMYENRSCHFALFTLATNSIKKKKVVELLVLVVNWLAKKKT